MRHLSSSSHLLQVCTTIVLLLLLAAATTGTQATAACPRLAPYSTTTIRDLRPAAVKVVAAIGDSITAGFSITGTFFENRGLSWSIGGDTDATTFATILRSVRPADAPALVGASIGRHIPEIPYTPFHPLTDVLNGAQSGALIQNVPFQIEHLVKQLKQFNSTGSINYDKDWKVVTLLIGPNNVCWVCEKGFYNYLDNANHYEEYLRKTLQHLHDEIPRVLVNVITMFNLSQLHEVSKESAYCEKVHSSIGFVECPCAFTSNSTSRTFLDVMAQEYNKRIYKVVDDVNKRISNDEFAVVIQPFLEHIKIPNLQWLSTLDCFVCI